MRRALAVLGSCLVACGAASAGSVPAPALPGPAASEPEDLEAAETPSTSVEVVAGAELASLTGVRRPPASAAARLDASGEVVVPIDWRTLPMVAATASLPGMRHATLAADVVVGSHDAELVAYALDGGAELWRLPIDAAALVSSCGLVIVLHRNGVSAIAPTTGAIEWEHALAPPSDDPDVYMSEDSLASRGCTLVLHLDDAGRRVVLPGDSSHLQVLDAATGSVTADLSCPGPCEVTSLEPDGVLVEADAARALLSYDGRSVERLPDWTVLVTEATAVTLEPQALWGRDRRTGDVRWTHVVDAAPHSYPPGHRVMVRLENDVVLVDSVAVRRIELDSGRERWRVPLGEGLRDCSRVGAAIADGERAILSCGPFPPVILELDVLSGAPRSLRIATVNPDEAALAEDHALLWEEYGSVVVDLTHDGAAVRDALSLEDDVARTLRTLDVSANAYATRATAWSYPRHHDEAVEWLGRLAPEIGDVVSTTLAATDPEIAAPRLAAIPDARVRTLAAAAVLRQTYGAAIDDRIAQTRTLAAAALSTPLNEDDADALLAATVSWLDELLARDPTADLIHRAEATGLVACRDALFRTAPSDRTLHAWRTAVARHTPEAAVPPCEPGPNDEIFAAVLHYIFELGRTPYAPVVAIGSTCVRAASLDGPITVGSTDIAGTRIALHEPTPADAASAEIAWTTIETRAVHALITSRSSGIEYVFHVQRVEALWRVVSMVSIGTWCSFGDRTD